MPKRSEVAIVVLWIALLAAAGLATKYALAAALDAVSKVVVAVLAGFFVLMAAVLTHALAEHRERALEARRRKQERYADILERLGPYLRESSQSSDNFSAAVLNASIVGAPGVLRAIRKFRNTKHTAELDEIILAMRSDLEMPHVENEMISTAGLFPTQTQKGLREAAD